MTWRVEQSSTFWRPEAGWKPIPGVVGLSKAQALAVRDALDSAETEGMRSYRVAEES